MIVNDHSCRSGWRIKILDFGIAKFCIITNRRHAACPSSARFVPCRPSSARQQVRRCEHRHLLPWGLCCLSCSQGNRRIKLWRTAPPSGSGMRTSTERRDHSKALWHDAPPQLVKLVARCLKSTRSFARLPKRSSPISFESGQRFQIGGRISSNQTLASLQSVIIPNGGSLCCELFALPQARG